VRLEARRAQPDLPAVTIRDLLRASLRHRPDRIVVGEVRGGEAYDLLQTLNTGRRGGSPGPRARQRLGCGQTIAGFHVSINCRFCVSTEVEGREVRVVVLDEDGRDKWNTHA
jgi:hypothetical protein